MVTGDILSVLPLDHDWRRVRREYWWRALAAARLPPRPTALFIGLGGGTQVHLLHQLASPRLVTIIERDPAIIRVAARWFGLDAFRPLELVCAEAAEALAALVGAGRRFDFVMEDAAYGEHAERSRPLAEAAAALVAPGGALVVNRNRRGDGRALAKALRPRFTAVRLRRVHRDGENALVCCVEPITESPRPP